MGSLLLMSYDGAEVPDYITRRLRDGEGSGVIVFGPNAPDEDTLRAATSAIQDAAGDGALVATDQEGGDIRSVAFATPEPRRQTCRRPSTARWRPRGAQALREAGVNVNLAPVADVATVPGSVVAGRAFPGDAARCRAWW